MKVQITPTKHINIYPSKHPKVNSVTKTPHTNSLSKYTIRVSKGNYYFNYQYIDSKDIIIFTPFLLKVTKDLFSSAYSYKFKYNSTRGLFPRTPNSSNIWIANKKRFLSLVKIGFTPSEIKEIVENNSIDDLNKPLFLE